MKRTNIYLEPEQTAQLDRLAAAEGVSRAEIIRKLLDRALAGRADDIAADLATIDASFGALAELDHAERGPGERERHLNKVWQASE